MSDERGAYELQYRQLLSEQERRRLDQFATESLSTPSEPAVKPAAAPKPAPKPGVVGTGLGTAKETAGAGVSQFVQGLYNAAGGKIDKPAGSVSDTAGEVLSGMGETLLGGLTVLMAIPAGVGAAVHRAMELYVPGLDRSVALPGEDRPSHAGFLDSPAAAVRSIAGLPAMLLDPKMRAILRDNPQQLANIMNEPMTYGELLDIVTQFAVPIAAGKMLPKRAAVPAPGPASEPLRVQKALPPGAYESGPSPLADYMPRVGPRALPAAPYEAGPSSIVAEPMTAESVAARLMVLGEELRGGAGPGPETGAGTPKPQLALPPGRYESGPSSLAPPPTLQEPLTIEALNARLMVAGEQLRGGAAPGKTAVQGEVPARGGMMAELAAPSGPLSTAAEISMEKTGGLLRLSSALDVAMKRAAEAIGDETGGLNPGLLARMAVGAAIGGTQGDTPEERITSALIGMGLGAAAGRIAKRVAETIRRDPAAAPVLDPTNTKVTGWSQRPAVQGSETFQPNYARIETTPQTTRVMKNIYRAAAGDIAEQGRGVRTFKQTDKAAMELLTSGKMTPERIVAFEPGTILSAEEMKAAWHIEIRAAEQVSTVANDIAAGVPVEPGELRQAIAVSRAISVNVRSAKTETGRAFSALRDTASSRGTERIKIATEDIDRLAREWNPQVSEAELAAQIQAIPTTKEVSLWSRLYYAVPEAATEAMYGAMLSGKALVKNVIGNAVVMPLAAVDRSLASLAVWDKNRPMASEGPMAFMSMWEGTVEQLRLIRHWDELGAQAERLGGTHVESQSSGLAALGDMAAERGHSTVAKGFEWLHAAAQFGPGIMRRTDGMAKAVNGRMAIQWEAMRQARLTEGLTGDAYWKRVEELVADYSQLDPEALVRIKDFREHQTFTRPLEGTVLTAIQAGPSDPWLNLAYRMTVAPFVRTPLRLAEFGAEYTPGLNFLAKNFYREMGQGGASRAVAEARLASGLLVIGSFMYLAMQGLITGSEPTDLKQAKAMRDAGRPPQSFWDPLAQKYRSYAGMEPVTTLVSTGANLANILRQIPEADAMRLLMGAALGEVDSLNAKSYTQAISELTDVVKTGRTDAQYDKSLAYIRRRLSVFNPAGLKELESLVDPTQRRVVPSGAFDEDKSPGASVRREFQALLDEYRKGIPGLSGATDEQGRPLLKPVRNMFTGQEMVNDTWPFNPFTTTLAQGAPWAAELRRLDGAGLQPLEGWIGQRAPADIGMTEQPAHPGVRLTPSELDRWEVLMTQVATDRHGHLTDSLTNLVQSGVYQRQSDVTRRLMVQDRWNTFRQRAEGLLLRENPGLRDAVDQHKRAAGIEHLPTARQPAARERLHGVTIGPGLTVVPGGR